MLLAIKSRIWIFLVASILIKGLSASGQEPQDSLVIQQPQDSLTSHKTQSNDTIAIQHFDDPITVISDETAPSNTLPLDTYQKHSPAKAAIMSAVVPGLGQIYNKKYWKVPIVYAAIGISTYYFIKWQNEYERYRRAYIDINDGDSSTDYYNTLPIFPPNTSDEQKKQPISKYKDQYRTWRDWSILAVVISYGLNIIDANVDAHLLDYNIDDDISLNIRPCFLGNDIYSQKIGLNLCFTF